MTIPSIKNASRPKDSFGFFCRIATMMKSVPPVDDPSLKISEYPIPDVIPDRMDAARRFPV